VSALIRDENLGGDGLDVVGPPCPR